MEPNEVGFLHRSQVSALDLAERQLGLVSGVDEAVYLGDELDVGRRYDVAASIDQRLEVAAKSSSVAAKAAAYDGIQIPGSSLIALHVIIYE